MAIQSREIRRPILASLDAGWWFGMAITLIVFAIGVWGTYRTGVLVMDAAVARGVIGGYESRAMWLFATVLQLALTVGQSVERFSDEMKRGFLFIDMLSNLGGMSVAAVLVILFVVTCIEGLVGQPIMTTVPWFVQWPVAVALSFAVARGPEYVGQPLIAELLKLWKGGH